MKRGMMVDCLKCSCVVMTLLSLQSVDTIVSAAEVSTGVVQRIECPTPLPTLTMETFVALAVAVDPDNDDLDDAVLISRLRNGHRSGTALQCDPFQRAIVENGTSLICEEPALENTINDDDDDDVTLFLFQTQVSSYDPFVEDDDAMITTTALEPPEPTFISRDEDIIKTGDICSLTEIVDNELSNNKKKEDCPRFGCYCPADLLDAPATTGITEAQLVDLLNSDDDESNTNSRNRHRRMGKNDAAYAKSPVGASAVDFCCTVRFNLCLRTQGDSNMASTPKDEFCNESKENCLGPCGDDSFWFPLVEDPKPETCLVRFEGCSKSSECCGPLECTTIGGEHGSYQGCEVPPTLLSNANPRVGVPVDAVVTTDKPTSAPTDEPTPAPTVAPTIVNVEVLEAAELRSVPCGDEEIADQPASFVLSFSSSDPCNDLTEDELETFRNELLIQLNLEQFLNCDPFFRRLTSFTTPSCPAATTTNSAAVGGGGRRNRHRQRKLQILGSILFGGFYVAAGNTARYTEASDVRRRRRMQAAHSSTSIQQLQQQQQQPWNDTLLANEMIPQTDTITTTKTVMNHNTLSRPGRFLQGPSSSSLNNGAPTFDFGGAFNFKGDSNDMCFCSAFFPEAGVVESGISMDDFVIVASDALQNITEGRVSVLDGVEVKQPPCGAPEIFVQTISVIANTEDTSKKVVDATILDELGITIGQVVEDLAFERCAKGFIQISSVNLIYEKRKKDLKTGQFAWALQYEVEYVAFGVSGSKAELFRTPTRKPSMERRATESWQEQMKNEFMNLHENEEEDDDHDMDHDNNDDDDNDDDENASVWDLMDDGPMVSSSTGLWNYGGSGYDTVNRRGHRQLEGEVIAADCVCDVEAEKVTGQLSLGLINQVLNDVICDDEVPGITFALIVV